MNHRAPIAIIAILLYLICAGTAGAQTWVLTGKVEEKAGGEAIPYANIVVQGTQGGALSKEDGRYRLELSGEEAVLEISRMGYRRKVVRVHRRSAVQNFDIALEISDIRFDDVVISEGLQRVFDDPTLHLYDYEFYDDQLLVIVYDRQRRRSRLALVDERDSIIAVTDGPEAPGKLFRDCLGNVHAIGKQYACQLFVVDGQIALYRDSLETFRRVVEPCLASLDEYRYYKFGQGNDQVMHYVAYNAETREQNAFVQIKDKEKIHQMIDPLGIYAGFARTEAQLLAIPPAMWEKINKIDHEYQFHRLAFFYPISAPLQVLDEQVYLFDHTNGLLHRLGKDGRPASSGEVPIHYHKERHWERVIYSDPIRGEAYAVYRKNGMVTLREIDLETGELKGSYEIPRQFPHRIQVRDGVAYFLYKELDYDPTNRLYRLRLKD